ncbi:hypothetical protein FLONG3_4497 [Fusarium longipes]|uniref:Uncharacterized protein n=1 Tax=Fusarium longipes TaxID=694270 RepID=A0A395SZ02_9HYPO|nr:hypothetical protein FLONG3_4497 [Fusarium longipes]
MRLPFNPLTFLAGLSATVKLVEAGHYSRGVEALFMYTAYRMDVELSAAKAIAEGTWDPNDPDAEKPWKLARDIPDDDAHTTESDWDQPRDRSKYGHNFHSFIRQTQGKSSRYPQSGTPGFDDLKDRWNPSLEDVKMMAKWGAPKDTNTGGTLDPSQKYPYNGFELRKLLGGCCDGNAGADNRDSYFRWHNILSIVGYRVKELYEQDPTAGKPFYDKMRACLVNAHIARTLESEHYKIQGVRKLFSQIKNVSQNWVKVDNKVLMKDHINGADREESIWRGNDDTMDALNTDETKKNIKAKLTGGNKPIAKSTIEALKDISKNWGSTKASDSSSVWGDDQTVLHEKVREQTYVLRRAMQRQMKSTDGSSEGCGFIAPSPPKGS